jgi:hypothetical protein
MGRKGHNQMETRIVTADLDGKPVRIVVSEATTLLGFRRTRLRTEGQGINQAEQDAARQLAGTEEAPSPDPDRALLRFWTYPDLVAATIEASGIPWPLSFEDFLDLPDQLSAKWETAVYDLNPHWLPQAPDAEKTQKKRSRRKAKNSTAD